MDEREIQITEDERAAIEKVMTELVYEMLGDGYVNAYYRNEATPFAAAAEYHAIQIARRVIRDNVTQRDEYEQTVRPRQVLRLNEIRHGTGFPQGARFIMVDDTEDKGSVRAERSFGL